ncbi:insulin-like growth factor-binding protein complex acid labile subunit [Leguminivora glycinivorella]|uniref:insulin-like growth factor-binding protein complex acid labile subunit n=1 Tax=Leguminivora glycinivorella TaxID=1035111 RepID=UPI00200C965D|nr:insulin-like growth factor-binding protein complex acid labile subunit [Leguminivora glycinivorella]
MDNTAKAAVLLTLLIATGPLVASDCNIHEVGDDSPCGGRLLCTRDLSDAVSLIVQMPCVYLYNDYSDEHILHQNFTISIHATDFDFTANDSAVINNLKDHINAISITDGKIKKFPDAVLNLRQATIVDLSKNNIDSLNLAAFAKPSVINVLNMSYNNIERLDAQIGWPSFWQLPVTTIDFSHNNIQGVLQNNIAPYVTLRHLNLSYNYIESLSKFTFGNLTGLLTLDISNNKIFKLDSSLDGLVSLQELYLDHNDLTHLSKDNFRSLFALQYLNISSNSLKSIESSSFIALSSLKQLDLSNNMITAILKSTFQNNSVLYSLDVSFNKISKIESGAFAGAHITDLKLHNNTLAGYLDTDAFNGLYFEKLDLSDADIGELGPDLFGPHPTFRTLDFSNNCISKISKTTFRNLDYLQELDLSHNKLRSIDFDTTGLKNLSHFYIKNNDIKQIRRDAFEPLTKLQMVDLSNNSIENIQIQSFNNLKILHTLNLQNNPISDIPRQTFSGLSSCYDLDLSGSKIKTLRNNSFNGMVSLNKLNLSHSDIKLLEFNVFNGTKAIEFLDLSFNQIESFSINSIHLKLTWIYLSYNVITSISDIYFQKQRSINLIDMSHNKISYIQPGSFMDCENLYNLNLNHNYLSFLQFGVFEGLSRVGIINLSNNRFHRFDGKLFYELPNLQVIYLDNNFIDKINLTEFSLSRSTATTLSIGGNPLICDILLKFIHDGTELFLRAESPNYETENVNGITCKSQTEMNNSTQDNDNKKMFSGNEKLEKLLNVTNQYLATIFGTLICAMLAVICVSVYFKFRNKLMRSRVVSSSREVLSNAMELESNED